MEIVEDVACTLCGCVCDDLKLTVENGRVTQAERACGLAEPWLLRQQAGPPVVVDQQAIQRAAEILRRSRAPLIYGLSRGSTPGQRAAVELADRLGGCIDTTASTCHAPSIMALQSVGESTSSLGEVRNRSDLVIYWGSNPVESHPRHLERVVEAPGLFVPNGRADRHLVVVDIHPTATSDRADTFLQVERGSDFDVLWALRGLVAGLDIAETVIGGVPVEQLRQLAERLRTCRYGAVFFGLGLTAQPPAHLNVEALLRLVTDLNRSHIRFIARRMRVQGDVAGADSVLCWQTGYPFSVNLAKGYPRYNPGEYSANDLLERGEVDAAVIIGSESIHQFSDAARRYLRQLPTIVLDYPGQVCEFPATVRFTTAVYGIHRRGTAYRMDETPIPLRQVLSSSLPDDAEILHRIMAALSTADPSPVSSAD